MVTYFKCAYDKHARFGSAKSPTTQGCDSAHNVTKQAKEELLQLMLQSLSNQKEVAEAATVDKDHLHAMSDSNSKLLEIIKKLNQQNEKLTEQNTKSIEALAKAKPSRGGGGSGGRGCQGGGDTAKVPAEIVEMVIPCAHPSVESVENAQNCN